MQFRRLVFPAPLGPMSAWMVRGATSKLTPDRAASPPNERLRSSTPRIAPMLVRERLDYGDAGEVVGEERDVQLHPACSTYRSRSGSGGSVSPHSSTIAPYSFR